MTADSLLRLAEFYDGHLAVLGVVARPSSNPVEIARSMCREIDRYLAAGRTVKALRAVAFVQGVLVASSVFTWDETKHHTRIAESILDYARDQELK